MIRLRKLLGAADPVGVHIAAGRLYASARWQGVTPRSPNDCVVAAVAVEARMPLLHDDKDFEQLAAVETRLRVVPRH
ncbi:MAG TPA: PIN domain-containing protein [Steroidobacteraceae bacterium]|nr:PIN domain-containing protein [Steroidobacteraceae bacterium]